MSKLCLTREEKLTIENNFLKENNFQLQIGILQNDRQQMLKNFCEKNGRSLGDIVHINVQEGYMEFKEPILAEKQP